MDFAQIQSAMKCIKHKKNEIIYIQVNEIDDTKSIFYCETCVSIDYNFKPQNYVRIKQVLESNNESTIFSWPPLNDNTIQQQLIQLSIQDQKEYDNINVQIKTYFEELKVQLLQKINECYRKATNLVLEFPEIEKHIISEYQKISQISKFKELLTNKQTDFVSKESQCRSFINEYLLQKEKNTQIFKQIFNEKDKLKQAINLDALEQIKKQIILITDQYFDSNVFSLQEFKDNLKSLKQILKEEPVKNQVGMNIPMDFIKQEDIISQIYFIQSSYCEDKYDRLSVSQNKNNQTIEFNTQTIKIGWSGCYYTNLILERNKEYVFKFRMRQKSNEKKAEIQFGLASNAQYDKFFPYDNLSCLLQISDNKLNISEINQGIANVIKGDFKSLSSYEDMRLIVNINEGLLELSDTNQNHRSQLLQKYQHKLQTYQNLRFFMQINCYATVTLFSVTKS